MFPQRMLTRTIVLLKICDIQMQHVQVTSTIKI